MANAAGAALELSTASSIDRRWAHATYDFSEDGGAQGNLTLFSFSQATVVHRLWLFVETAGAGTNMTLDVDVVSGTANGLFDAIPVASLTQHAIFNANTQFDVDALLAKMDADFADVTNASVDYEDTLKNEAGAVVLPLRIAADGAIQMSINTADLTAGKIHFYCEYSNAPA